MARMLGRLYPPHCPAGRGRPWLDCPDRVRDTRTAKRAEARRQLTDG